MVKNKYKKSTASIVVFVLSAVLHEYLVSIPLHMYKIGVFLGMMVQVRENVSSQIYLDFEFSRFNYL